MALAMVMMVVTRVKMVMMMAMYVHVSSARMLRSMQATQGHAWAGHGLPGALYKASPWAPRESSSQPVEDAALLSMGPFTPGAVVMIVVLVVTTVIISPSAPNAFVVVVVVWHELGAGAGV